MKCKDCGTTWEQSRCPECAIGGRGIGGIETTTPKDQLVIDAAREWVAASDAFILADCKEKSAETLVVDERHRPPDADETVLDRRYAWGRAKADKEEARGRLLQAEVVLIQAVKDLQP